MMDITVRISDADYKTYCEKLSELQLVYNGSKGLNFIESDVVEVADGPGDDQEPDKDRLDETDEEQRNEIRKAINAAARKMEAYWDAERDIELITEIDIDDLGEVWIEPLAISGGDISDEDLDLFMQIVAQERAKEEDSDAEE